MKIQQIMTLRLPELCSYPQELMFSLSTSSSPSSSITISSSVAISHSSPSSSNPITPPPPNLLPQSCQDVASFRSEAEWVDLAPFLSLCFCSRFLSFFLFFLKSTHVYAPNLCTLCFSTSRHKLNPGLMRTGSPLCTCSEGEGGRQREQKKREREREHEE